MDYYTNDKRKKTCIQINSRRVENSENIAMALATAVKASGSFLFWRKALRFIPGRFYFFMVIVY
jgi:hypothetical protein